MRARVQSANKGFRRRRSMLLALSVVALAFLLMVSAGSANLPGSTFQGSDGNLIVDNPPGGTDWANVQPAISCPPNPVVGCLVDTPSGSSDNSFTQGSSEDDPNVHIDQGSIPNNKDDLLRSYLSTDSSGNAKFLYLAWIRAQTSGDAHIDFELNQNATPNWTASTTGALTINRTAGDVLITYDFGGSGHARHRHPALDHKRRNSVFREQREGPVLGEPGGSHVERSRRGCSQHSPGCRPDLQCFGEPHPGRPVRRDGDRSEPDPELLSAGHLHRFWEGLRQEPLRRQRVQLRAEGLHRACATSSSATARAPTLTTARPAP